MRKLAAWLSSLATTVRIMVFERETYRALRDPGEFPDDYVEVFRPGGDDE